MEGEERRVRVLLAKPGLDGHDRGIRIVARALRDAGMEVVFLGRRVTPEMVVKSALEEDVDLIGLSVFSGGHMTVVPNIVRALAASEARDVPVIVGGIVPPEDARELRRIGVQEIFGPGSDTAQIVSHILSVTGAD